MWNTPQGGVAVLVREGLIVEMARLPRKRESDPLVWDLWHSTRSVDVRVAVGVGATVLPAVSVYGLAGNHESNMALWEDVLHHLSGLGNALHIVGADCNFPLGRLRDVPQVMLANLLTRRLVDLDLEYAGSEERFRCGYMRRVEVAGMHIDGIRADPRIGPPCCKWSASPARGSRDTHWCTSTWRWGGGGGS